MIDVPKAPAMSAQLRRRKLRAFLLRVFASSLFLFLLSPIETRAALSHLCWDDSTGPVFQAGRRTVWWGDPATGDSLRLRFPASNVVQRLREPSQKLSQRECLVLAYDTQAPDGVPLKIERALKAEAVSDGFVLFETFRLSAARPLTNDIEVEIPFVLPIRFGSSASSLGGLGSCSATCPLKNGWARSFALSPDETRVEYRLGSFLTSKETQPLALPLVEVREPGCTAAIFADPMFSTLFSVRSGKDGIEGTLRFRYAASKVPISGPEVRSFAIWLPKDKRFGQGVPRCCGRMVQADAAGCATRPQVAA